MAEPHVFLTRVDLARCGDRADAERVLSADERARAARFVRSIDGDRYALTRAALRHLLACHLDVRPDAVRFRYGRHGKPTSADAPWCRFNVTHAGTSALMAVSHCGSVGVDLEPWAAPEPDVVAAVLTPSEQARVSRAPNRAAAFTDHWTLKEAWLKAAGTGLYRAPISLEMTPGRPFWGDGIAVWSVDAGPGWSAALALACPAGTEPVVRDIPLLRLTSDHVPTLPTRSTRRRPESVGTRMRLRP